MKESRKNGQEVDQFTIYKAQFLKLKTNQVQLLKSKPKEDALKWFKNQVTSKQHNGYLLPKITQLEIITTTFCNVLGEQTKKYVLHRQQSRDEIFSQSEDLVEIAFILKGYFPNHKDIYKQQDILQALLSKVQNLFLHQKQLNKFKLLRVESVINFKKLKAEHPEQKHNQLSKKQLEALKEEITIIYMYIIKPLFEKKKPLKLFPKLLHTVNWLVVLTDESKDQEQLVLDITKKINLYICRDKNNKQSIDYNNFIQTLKEIMDLLSINYLKDDNFKPYLLSPLLNHFASLKFREIIYEWLANQKISAFSIQYALRHSFQTGSLRFSIRLFKDVSYLLKQKKQFDKLYHIFISFVRKDFIKIFFKDRELMQDYLQMIEFYSLGFINRDRFQNQQQLDIFTSNLQNYIRLITKPFKDKLMLQRLIYIYRIYEHHFGYLSSISKDFLRNIQKNLKFPKLTIVQMQQKVDRFIFREASVSVPTFCEQQLSQSTRYKGLMNLGNTCYLNSLMQALFMTKKFRLMVLKAKDDASIGIDKKAFHALANLFSDLQMKSLKDEREIWPNFFKENIPEPFNLSTEQHDTAEFARCYLNYLLDHLNQEPLKQAIKKFFFQTIKKTISCTNCNHFWNLQENMLDFIIPVIKEDQEIIVSKMLQNLCAVEKLQGDNKVICQECTKCSVALMKPGLSTLAEHLIMTIGLFEFKGELGNKVKKPIKLELSLNMKTILPNFFQEEEIYQLYAFIVHIGNYLGGGHYICYARMIEDNPNLWLCFDDNFVFQKKISKPNDFNFGDAENPYMLFYRRAQTRSSIQMSQSPKK